MENRFESFGERVGNFLPDLLAALLILLIGWLIARGIKSLIVKLLRRTSWDERVFGKSNVGDTNIFLANIVYYLVMIIVILAVLEVLGINEALAPLGNMLNEFLLFIPNLIGAILIGFIGYLLAKFVSNLIYIGGNFLDKFVDKTGFKDTARLVRIVRKIIFIVIFVPFLIQAFNALQMDAISQPANDVLYAFTEMIGQILVAALILIVFIWGGKFLANFLEDLFRSLGLDSAAEKIQIDNMIGANQSLSRIFANLIYFFLVFFGIITAVEILGLDRLTITLNEILEVTGQIIFGLVILAVGNYISLLIYNTMTRSSNNTFIAGVIRWSSLALFIAIALRTMGIANEIVELAFGLILGAIAVAVALSYGLGGREAAGEHFRDIIQKFREEARTIPAENTPDLSGDRPFSSTSSRNFGSETPPAGTSYGTNNPGIRPENTGTGSIEDNPGGGNRTTNPGGPGSGPEENRKYNPASGMNPGRQQQDPNNPYRSTQNPNPPSRGPENTALGNSGTPGTGNRTTNPGGPGSGPEENRKYNPESGLNPGNQQQDPNNPYRGTQNPNPPSRGPENTALGNSGTPGTGNRTTNPGGPGSGPEEHKRFDSGTSAQPGRQENPNRPQRGPENPNPPSRGPENPGRPDTGPQNPDSPSQGPENPDRPNRGPENPDRI